MDRSVKAVAALIMLIACAALARGARGVPSSDPTAQQVTLATVGLPPNNIAGDPATGLPVKLTGSLPHNLVLLSIAQPDGAETLGVKTPAGIVDVRYASVELNMPAPMTLEALLRNGGDAQLHALVEAATASKTGLVDESSIKYGRLLTNPGKIVCVGLNYMLHAIESGMQPPRVPPLFNKYVNSLAAANSVVTLPPKDVAYKIDYETELLVIIGKAAHNVPESEALNYVAGYSIGHDLSARDLQLELPSGQWMVGKTLDNFAPIGPYFVTPDLVGNPNNLQLETFVNGERVQNANTNDFIKNVQQQIAYISKFWTLQPGDIIFTGTPQGVIHGRRKEDQVWLKAGDKIVSKIEKLGELKFVLA